MQGHTVVWWSDCCLVERSHPGMSVCLSVVSAPLHVFCQLCWLHRQENDQNNHSCVPLQAVYNTYIHAVASSKAAMYQVQGMTQMVRHFAFHVLACMCVCGGTPPFYAECYHQMLRDTYLPRAGADSGAQHVPVCQQVANRCI